jgi:hypothetical protein
MKGLLRCQNLCHKGEFSALLIRRAVVIFARSTIDGAFWTHTEIEKSNQARIDKQGPRVARPEPPGDDQSGGSSNVMHQDGETPESRYPP